MHIHIIMKKKEKPVLFPVARTAGCFATQWLPSAVVAPGSFYCALVKSEDLVKLVVALLWNMLDGGIMEILLHNMIIYRAC